MQPVRLIHELGLRAGPRARVEQGVGELSIVADREHGGGSVGAVEIHDVDVLRVRVDDPLEGCAVAAVLRLADQDTMIGLERVGAHAVDDLEVVVVVAAAVTIRVCPCVAGWRQVGAGSRYACPSTAWRSGSRHER